MTYFVYATLLDAGISNPEAISQKIKSAFVAHPNWTTSEKDLREVRQKMTLALYAEADDVNAIAATVERLITLLMKAQNR